MRVMMPAEASLVSPHGRSLSACPGLGTVGPLPATDRCGWTAGMVRAKGQTRVARASRSAARTSVAWSSGLTFGQTWAMRPSGPTRKLVRTMPQ